MDDAATILVELALRRIVIGGRGTGKPDLLRLRRLVVGEGAAGRRVRRRILRNVGDTAWRATNGRGGRKGAERVGVVAGGHGHALEFHVELLLGEGIDA